MFCEIMGFEVRLDALDNLYNDVKKRGEEWCDEIDAVGKAVNSIVSSSNMAGAGAESAQHYLDSVHNTIIPMLTDLIRLHVNNCLLYVRDYQSEIEDALHAVIYEDELIDIKDSLKQDAENASDIDDEVQAALKSVSDIVSVSCTGVKTVCSKNTSIQNKITALIDDVTALEDSHSQKDFTETGELISALTAFIKERLGDTRAFKTNFSTAAITESASYLALSQAYDAVGIKNLDNQAAVEIAVEEEDARLFLIQYEADNAALQQKIDALLDKEKLTEEQIQAIKYIIYTAEEPYQSIYLNALGKYTLGDMSEGVKNGVFKTKNNTINLYINKYATDKRGAYYVFFHESGHAIDYNYQKNGTYYSLTYRNADGLSLYEVLYEDVKNNVAATIAKYTKSTSRQEHLLDYIIGAGSIDIDTLSDKEKEILSDIQDDYTDALAGPVNSVGSDIYGGVTNNIIAGPCSNENYGHSLKDNAYYWYDEGGNATLSQSKELWAEYYSYCITGNEEAMDSLREYFPTASGFLDEMAASMVE